MAKHKPGDNLTLLNVLYERPKRDEATGKMKSDHITLVYKDLDTGLKEHKTIYDPKFTFFKLKKGKEKPYNQFFAPIDDCEEVTVPYKDLEKEIARETGHLDDFYENCRNHNRSANKLFNTDPRILCSDIGIESFYRMEFDRTYKNASFTPTKCFLDIEVDTKPIGGVFPAPGECPVNAVSVLMQQTMTEYVFILKDPENPNSIEFENYIKTHDFRSEYIAFLNEDLGGWKNTHRMGLSDLQFKWIFYDREEEMLLSIFKLINTIQPDFVLAWNMAFDIPYLMKRMELLGIDPSVAMTHPDFEERNAYYYIDQLHNLAEQKGDYAFIPCYSVYLDQMIQFASRRKGQSAYANNKLDYIGEVVAGCRKLDYHDITENLSDLPYVDFKTFIMYNMTDVIVQWCIEHKTGDIDYVFNKAIMNSTQYGKVHRQTVYLANRATMYFRNKGFIIGNNVNKYNDLSEEEKKKRKYPGAYVAPAMLVGDEPKVKLMYDGMQPKPINVMHNANDFDYKALYPSLMRENNIAPNTIIGMIQIPKKIYKDENPFHLPVGIYKNQFNRAETFVENFASHCYIEFGQRWFNLAGYEDMLDDILEYFTHIERPLYPLNMDLAQKGRFDDKSMYERFDDRKKIVYRLRNGKIPVVARYKDMPDWVRKAIERYEKELGGEKVNDENYPAFQRISGLIS